MDTFSVTYQISVLEGESIDQKIDRICLEQSAELPRDVLSDRLEEQVPGRIRRKKRIDERRYTVIIDWPTAHLGGEITQLLNLLFGNISLNKGIRIDNIDWQALPEEIVRGPVFGIEKLRRQWKIHDRPLSSSAVKPLGLSADECAQRVYQMACGGIDIIKDDHGLTDQRYAPFNSRTEACVEAVRQAAMDTDHHALYFPNITGDAATVYDRCKQAEELGADGVLLCPHLTGLPTLAALASSGTSLPIIAHPAFSGALVGQSNHGMTPSFLYGKLWRALGADLVIFPNTGGRFSFSLEQCRGICRSAADSRAPFRRSFPMIGGGIELEELSDWIETYGEDAVFLIGTSLYQHPEGLRYASRQFSEIIRGNT